MGGYYQMKQEILWPDLVSMVYPDGSLLKGALADQEFLDYVQENLKPSNGTADNQAWAIINELLKKKKNTLIGRLEQRENLRKEGQQKQRNARPGLLQQQEVARQEHQQQRANILEERQQKREKALIERQEQRENFRKERQQQQMDHEDRRKKQLDARVEALQKHIPIREARLQNWRKKKVYTIFNKY